MTFLRSCRWHHSEVVDNDRSKTMMSCTYDGHTVLDDEFDVVDDEGRLIYRVRAINGENAAVQVAEIHVEEHTAA